LKHIINKIDLKNVVQNVHAENVVRET